VPDERPALSDLHWDRRPENRKFVGGVRLPMTAQGVRRGKAALHSCLCKGSRAPRSWALSGGHRPGELVIGTQRFLPRTSDGRIAHQAWDSARSQIPAAVPGHHCHSASRAHINQWSGESRNAKRLAQPPESHSRAPSICVEKSVPRRGPLRALTRIAELIAARM
jgi:hypothetical protein